MVRIPIVLTADQLEMLRKIFQTESVITEALAEQIRNIILVWEELGEK